LENASATPADVYETIDESWLRNAQQQPPLMTSSNVVDLYENTGSNNYDCTLVENDLYPKCFKNWAVIANLTSNNSAPNYIINAT